MKQIGWLLLVIFLGSCSTINIKRNGYYQTIRYKPVKRLTWVNTQQPKEYKPEVVIGVSLKSKNAYFPVIAIDQSSKTEKLDVSLVEDVTDEVTFHDLEAKISINDKLQEPTYVKDTVAPEPQKTHWAAMVSIVFLIFSFSGLSPLAVLFGLIALKKIKMSPEVYKGRRQARLSVVLGSIISMLLLLGLAIYGGIPAGILILLELLFLGTLIWGIWS